MAHRGGCRNRKERTSVRAVTSSICFSLMRGVMQGDRAGSLPNGHWCRELATSVYLGKPGSKCQQNQVSPRPKGHR